MNVAFLKEVSTNLAEPKVRIIQEMREEVGIPITNLAIDTGLTEQEVRNYLGDLRQLGVVDFGFLMSEDQGQLMGRGYWLDTFGSAVAYLAGVRRGLVQRRELALLSDSFTRARDLLASRYRTVALSHRRPLFLTYHNGLWCHGTIFTDVERLRGWELWGYLELGRPDKRLIEMAESRVRQ